MKMSTRYTGPERRIHKIYVTRNTEYHLRRDVCVAVKSLNPGDGRVAGQLAVNMRLGGRMKQGRMLPVPGLPKIGFGMYFARGGYDVFTGRVVEIRRPSKSVVAEYPPES